MTKVEGGPWDGFEIISTYTDEDAVRDGVLHVFEMRGSMKDRVTAAVWGAFTRTLMGVMTDVTGLCRAWDFMAAQPPDADGWRAAEYQGRKLWLIPNEVGGLTLMFPEDY